jgi:transcriptional regulator with XRE-family HTH domain
VTAGSAGGGSKSGGTAAAPRPPAIDYAALGEMVRIRVQESGRPASECARAAGVSKTALSNLLHGKHRPTRETFLKLCRWLELPPERFVEGVSEPSIDEIERAILRDPNLRSWDALELARLMRAAYVAVTKRRA